MSPLEPIDPIVESPLSHPLLKQRAIASELLTEVQHANTAIGGMLLVNMERNCMCAFDLSTPIITRMNNNELERFFFSFSLFVCFVRS